MLLEKTTRYTLLVLSLLLLVSFSRALNKEDSLRKNILSKSTHDTIKISSLNSLSRLYSSINPDTSLILSDEAITLAKKISNQKFIASSYLFKGNAFFALGEFEKAEGAYQQALEFANKAGVLKIQGGAYTGLGNAYNNLGNYDKAALFYTNALKIQEEIKDSIAIANSLTGLGTVFEQQANYSEALNYQLKAIKIKELKGSKQSLATSYNNVGLIYYSQKKFNDALIYFNKAIDIFNQGNNLTSLAMAYANIGNAYSEMGNKSQALVFKKNAYLIYQKLGNEDGMASQLLNLGIEYSKYNQHREAIENMLKCEDVAKRLNSKQLLLDCYSCLHKSYNLSGNVSKAYEYSEKYIELNKEMFNEERGRQINELNTKYQTEKKQKEIELLNKDKKISELQLSENENKLNRQRIVIIGAVVVLLLLVFVAFMLFSQNKLKQKTNEQLAAFNIELKNQKHIIEEKQKEILDSITYAKRLQEAILPDKKEIESVLNQRRSEFFILYQPKDIVAGDFYFFERKGDLLFFAAADCTGHGVPGAMVSVVCSTALNRSVNEFNLCDTGKILDKTRELVLETFAKNDKNVKDGMDISLCSLSLSSLTFHWSGANNPLWYFNTGVFKEIKADKQPIGQTEDPKPFSQNAVSVNKGDMIYLLTDGYADQFGGPKGKKFKYKQLEEILVEIHTLPATDQELVLRQKFDAWRGQLEQVDDVSIIGIRI